MDKIFAWQSHLGRYGEEERRHQAHEVFKVAIKDLALLNANPGSSVFLASIIMNEPPHLRLDKSRQGDVMAMGRDVHRLDSAMDVVIASQLTKSCVFFSHKSSGFVPEAAKDSKFGKDRRSCNPIPSFSTMRFISLALNNMGMRVLTPKRSSRSLQQL